MNPIYVIISVLIAIVIGVSFWFISKKAPNGTLLAAAIGFWIIGQIIGSQTAREMKVIGGTIATLGTIGFVLALIDLFRKRKKIH
jgi:hypothetical protein